MEHKVLAINKVDGLPVIPGAHSVSKSGDYIIAYGPPVPGVNTKWMCGPDQVIAYLREYKPGHYIVIANQDKLDMLDPLNEGKTADKVPDLVPADFTGVIAGANFGDEMGVEIVVEEPEK